MKNREGRAEDDIIRGSKRTAKIVNDKACCGKHFFFSLFAARLVVFSSKVGRVCFFMLNKNTMIRLT